MQRNTVLLVTRIRKKRISLEMVCQEEIFVRLLILTIKTRIMKTANLLAQRLSLKIGPLVLINEKDNVKLSYKGNQDLSTDIVVLSFEEMDDKTLLMLNNVVERYKKNTKL